MKSVAKCNIFKGISTVLTVGTPIATLFSCNELIVHRSDTAISAAAVFVIILVLFLCKNKIAEKFKVTSAFVLSAIVLGIILLVENILLPMKCVCIATIISSGIDEITFKKFYKNIESTLPKEAAAYNYFGFLFTTTKKLERLTEK